MTPVSGKKGKQKIDANYSSNAGSAIYFLKRQNGGIYISIEELGEKILSWTQNQIPKTMIATHLKGFINFKLSSAKPKPKEPHTPLPPKIDDLQEFPEDQFLNYFSPLIPFKWTA